MSTGTTYTSRWSANEQRLLTELDAQSAVVTTARELVDSIVLCATCGRVHRRIRLCAADCGAAIKALDQARNGVTR